MDRGGPPRYAPPAVRHTEAIIRFLDSLGRASDGQFYLGLFHSLPRESFAVLCVDRDVVRESLDALTLDLRYLSQLELYPTVVFGLLDGGESGRDADAALEALARSGVGAVRVDRTSPRLREEIRAALGQGKLPLLPLEGIQRLDDRFELLARILEDLRTRKLIFVRRRGRLGRAREDRISVVNLNTDYDALLSSGLLTENQARLLVHVRRLLCERLEHRVLAAVTSPLNLLQELFTVKGAGTLIQRGAIIRRHDDWTGVDRDRLRMLLESSFGRRLRPSFLDEPFSHLYLEASYRGAAIVRQTPNGAYLSKFAVETAAQGEGLGRDLWNLLTADSPTLFWRARRGNRIEPFYTKACDGLARFPRWTVYWIGVPPERIEAVIRWALAAPEDFVG